MKKTYGQAIIELIALGREVDLVLSRAKVVMENRGHARLYLQVLKDVVSTLEAQAGANTPKVIVARGEDTSTPAVAKALALIDCADQAPLVTVDYTIIGGVVATHGHRHVDMSHKALLLKLYQAITA